MRFAPRARARLELALYLAVVLGLVAAAARGQQIAGPSEVEPYRLARLSIAWPEGASPGKAAWLVTPIDGADFAAIDDRLILTGVPGSRLTVIAAIVLDGNPAFLTHQVAIKGVGPVPPKPDPDDDDPDPLPPTPDPTPIPGTVWAILLYDDATLTPGVAGLRSSPLLAELPLAGGKFLALEIDSAEARSRNYGRDMEAVRRVGGPPAILYLDDAGKVHDAAKPTSVKAVIDRVLQLRGEK